MLQESALSAVLICATHTPTIANCAIRRSALPAQHFTSGRGIRRNLHLGQTSQTSREEKARDGLAFARQWAGCKAFWMISGAKSCGQCELASTLSNIGVRFTL